MIFTATKEFNIEPIGDIRFKLDLIGRKPKGKIIFIGEFKMHTSTRMVVSENDYKRLKRLMKTKGSDLLTDNSKFYYLYGNNICEIEHPQFEKELELHNDLYGSSI